MFINFKWWECS